MSNPEQPDTTSGELTAEDCDAVIRAMQDDGHGIDNSGTDASGEPEMFPRAYVEDLRQENGKYRQRAQQGDVYAQRLHTELVRATGRLADPTDLPFDAEHLGDPDKLSTALDDLLDRKPHLATRMPSGDVGQGQRGRSSSGFFRLDILKKRI